MVIALHVGVVAKDVHKGVLSKLYVKATSHSPFDKQASFVEASSCLPNLLSIYSGGDLVRIDVVLFANYGDHVY